MVSWMHDGLISKMDRERLSLAEAVRATKAMFAEHSIAIDQAAAMIRRQMDGIIEQEDTTSKGEYEQLDRWYAGPLPTHLNWKRFKETLESTGKDFLVPRLDRDSTGILALCANPRLPGSRRMGLVVGNVQSGKTANFTSVIAKAADSGYRFIIVLAGVHNNLRKQTQSRLAEELFSTSWFTLTTDDQDFGSMTGSPDGIIKGGVTMVAVVKKNGNRLANLINWYKTVPEGLRSNYPALILDDEADQATPSSATGRAQRSAINEKVRQLWSLIPTGTYLAYTATPFANVFMDPDDAGEMFPRDFIKAIEPGDTYFGAERIFGRADPSDGEGSDGIDVVRPVPDTDAATLRPPGNRDLRDSFDPELPDSLVDAVNWFVLASAARRGRGHRAHSSMLVHTTHYAAPHFALRNRIAAHVASLARDLDGRLPALRELWEHEKGRAAEVATGTLPTWDDLAARIPDVLGELRVIVDNGLSEDRLNYNRTDDAGDPVFETVIAVGGGTLSRGLTLEGLVVSYFVRTSNTYDTLMQMGRWFGYRPGYEDLQRVWAPDSLVDEYQFLALVEADLRAEIEVLSRSGYSPAQLGVKVRSHPGRLEITARNKMAHAKQAQVSLSGQRRQTFIFDASDHKAVRGNWNALSDLIAENDGLQELSTFPAADQAERSSSRAIVRSIGNESLIKFLRRFSFHEDQALFNADLMGRWLSKHAVHSTWNLVIMGNTTTVAPDGITELGVVDIGGRSFNSVNRAPLRGSHPGKINIKALMSPSDRLADLSDHFWNRDRPQTEAGYRQFRREAAPNTGLLLAYPISKMSTPRLVAASNSLTARVRMPSIPDHLLGIGLVFPYASTNRDDEGDFVSVKTSWDVDTSEDEEIIDREGSTVEGRPAS